MRLLAAAVSFLMLALPLCGSSVSPPNERIDIEGYLRVAEEAARYREARRVTEDEFLRLAARPGAIILDARSSEKFRELHIKGAINLSFADIAVESLKQAIPDPNTPILIYCNNNFSDAEGPFPTKIARASLNISTFIALYSYGYRNIWELGPLLQVRSSKLQFEGNATVNDE